MDFITGEEFENSTDKFMEIADFDTTDTYKIGVLTTNWID